MDLVLIIAALVIFVFGILIGVLIMRYGFLLGWKASYEIRNQKDESGEDKGLFPGKKEPAEFELLDELKQ